MAKWLTIGGFLSSDTWLALVGSKAQHVLLSNGRVLSAFASLPDGQAFLDRSLVLSHEAARDYEAKLTPVLAEALPRGRRGKIGRAVDETYVKIQDRWCHLSRHRHLGRGPGGRPTRPWQSLPTARALMAIGIPDILRRSERTALVA